MRFAEIGVIFVLAFLVNDYVTGTTRQCVYEFGPNQYYRTIPATRVCPLSIEVDL